MSDGTSPIQDYPRGITFEQVWAALLKGDQQMQELREKMMENAMELREQMKENAVELREQLKETRRDLNKTEQLVKATTKQMGGLREC